MPALSCLLIAFALALRHSGGLGSDQLLFIWVALWIGGVLLIVKVSRMASGAWLNLDSQPQPHLATWLLPMSVVLFAIALALSMFAGPLPGIASEQFFGMALLPAAYCFARVARAAGLSATRLWLLLHLAAMVLACVALAEKATTGLRSYTVMNDPNALAGVFNVFLVLAFADWLAQPRGAEARPELPLKLALYAAATGSTGSLSGLLCLATALVPLALLGAWRRPHLCWLAPVLALLLLALAVVCSRGPNDNPGAKLPGIAQHSSFNVRVEMAESSLAIYRDSPWYGSGLATYKLLYPQYRGPLDTGTTGDLVHNDYVQFLQEGGPLLLGSLLALVAYALGFALSLMRKLADHRQHWLQLGAAAAALCVLMQAGMNFVLYVTPLAFLIGLLMATVQSAPPKGLRRVVVSLPVMAGMVMVLLVLLGTLGARTVFLGVAMERCQWRACITLRSDPAFMKELTAFVAGTQPSWIAVSDYLISNALAGEAAAATEEMKATWRQRALKESLSLAERLPALGYPFINLGELIERDSKLSHLLPVDMPKNPADLYGVALAHQPQSLNYRLKTASALKRAGRETEAYQVLVTDGGRYWNMAAWGDGGRMHYLVSSIAVTSSLGRCAEAAEMSEGLKVFTALQREAAEKGVALPLPAGSLSPPAFAETEAALKLASSCIEKAQN